MARIQITIFLALQTFSLLTHAQLTKSEKIQVLDSAARMIEGTYIFPDKAKAVTFALREREKEGRYDTITNQKEFAAAVTRDLQNVTLDLHLKFNYDKKVNSSAKSTGGNNSSPSWLDQLMKDNNFGITSKSILPGNIGYINFSLFGPLSLCADSLVKAMEYVISTDALILDLRSCRGSLDQNTLPFFCGYFFEEPVHLADFYIRSENLTRQFWSAAWIPGKKYLNKPIYILTSGRTFSGGEAFSYDMQQLKRATIIGQVTRGGAHPTELHRLNDDFTLSIPYARTINAITKADWEQTGVVPDVAVRSNLALFHAQQIALTSVLKMSKDDNRKNHLQYLLDSLASQKPLMKKVQFTLEGYDKAQQVAVLGSFNFFAQKDAIMKKVNDVWIAEAEVEAGEIYYVFSVDGKNVIDPKNNQSKLVNGNLNSVMFVR
jgi:hypothetical protein